MRSIVSYPNRGNWGKSKYRGNCSGHIIVDLIKQFNPNSFLDVTEGSETSKEVCNEFNVYYKGLDLNKGSDLTQMSILNFVKNPFDMVFSHLPYHDMVNYNQERKKHGICVKPNLNDLSSCKNVDEFLEKSYFVLLNQREAVEKEKHYCTLIGDYRKNGNFYSFQSDFIGFMPKNELISVVIKQQHNYKSKFKSYNNSFIPITHEYLLIWKKRGASIYQVAFDKAKELKEKINQTWKNIVRMALINLNEKSSLDKIYNEVVLIAGEKIRNNPNYKAKIRQILQKHFVNIERGVWSV